MNTNKTKVRSRRPTLRGKGDYTLDVKSIKKPLERLEAKIDHLERMNSKPPKLISAAGRALGSLVGQPDLGEAASTTLAKFFGHGDYSIRTNSLIPNQSGRIPASSVVPSFSSGKRGTRITEREFIQDIYAGSLSGGSTLFTNTSFEINPTNLSTFPWLSSIANLYDQWEPHGIVFEFVSTSSEFNGSSQALGTVIMATDYDVLDAPYSSKQEMENSDYSCSTRPSNNLMHGIECATSERPTKLLYTSTAGPANFSQLGKFQIATTGCSVAGVRLGELWVSYDVTFYKKQMVPTYTIATTPHLSLTGTAAASVPYLTGAENKSSSLITFDLNNIYFNNTSIGTSYLVTFFLNTQSGTPFNWGVTGLTLDNNRIVNGSASNGVNIRKYTTTSLDASLQPSSFAAGQTSSFWSVNIVQVDPATTI